MRSESFPPICGCKNRMFRVQLGISHFHPAERVLGPTEEPSVIPRYQCYFSSCTDHRTGSWDHSCQDHWWILSFVSSQKLISREDVFRSQAAQNLWVLCLKCVLSSAIGTHPQLVKKKIKGNSRRRNYLGRLLAKDLLYMYQKIACFFYF